MAGSIAGRRAWSDDTWSYLNDPRMPAVDHGWKLHVSARPGDLDRVTELVLPVLLRHVCHAKWAVGPETLRTLNSGASGAGAVGKAVTVYPAPGTVTAIADELVAALRGCEGPRIVSDRRIDPGAPVYYRYGPFTGDYRTGRGGRLESVMTGPDGRAFDGLATAAYRCPPWARDPFAERDPDTGRSAAPTSGPTGGHHRVTGGRYRVTGGIARKPQGNLYRAVDLTDGRPVVIKQARAFVAEDASGSDARDRLRHERAVLTALDGVPGVPRVLDWFRHDADTDADAYLVMTDCGDRDLRREVQERGPFRNDDSGSARTLPALARGLLRLLDDIHARGVVVRDLKPDNVVLDAEGRCHLVDFGIGALGGTAPDGATPGYSEPVRRPDGPAGPADDHYALGATLHFAATGLDPVVVGTDTTLQRDRTLECLAWALPGEKDWQLRSLIDDLMSLDPAVRSAGAARLRSGAPAAAPVRSRVSRPPLPDDALLAEIAEHTLAYCVEEARRIIDPASSARAGAPTAVDVYGGTSGTGLELLHHTGQSGVRETVDALARWTAGQRRNLSPGFWSGRTGVELFLTAAAPAPHPGGNLPDGRRREADLAKGPGRYRGARPEENRPSGAPPGGGHPAQPERGPDGGLRQGPRPGENAPADHLPRAGGGPALPERGPGGGPPEADLIEGVAGIGVGRLLLARHARAAGDDALAARHLDVAAACERMLATGGARLTPAGATTTGSAALAEGMAHGRAGVAYFLLEYAAATGDPAAVRRAREACAQLAGVTPRVLAAAARPEATRRYGSWCRGLAGIGTVLVRAADRLEEPRYLELARDTARACAGVAPRMPLVTQCCGLAGVGELMVDVATATDDEEFWEAARTVAALALSRSGGTRARPVLPDADLVRASAGWAGGSAGVLAFFRRLRDRGGPRLGLLDPVG
ncbi:protein kinase domain-containing protein [Kitasatospora terrestris]|uniref:non-specific serine/threonine protein kinase n=1 Tax=Kitasatospora terrestris TaxID=258051 RepID=A0ABP9EIC8_9ACTN